MSTPAQTGARAEVVYVLGAKGSPTVKIGRSIDLAKRFADIQRMSPTPLEILWSYPGDHELETRLHRHFRKLRSHGEWFTFEGSPVEAIKEAVEQRPWLDVTRRRGGRPPRDPNEVIELPESLALSVTEAASLPDPVARYLAARDQRTLLCEADRQHMDVQRAAVLELRERKLSWREIGELLDTTYANVERIAKRR